MTTTDAIAARASQSPAGKERRARQLRKASIRLRQRSEQSSPTQRRCTLGEMSVDGTLRCSVSLSMALHLLHTSLSTFLVHLLGGVQASETTWQHRRATMTLMHATARSLGLPSPVAHRQTPTAIALVGADVDRPTTLPHRFDSSPAGASARNSYYRSPPPHLQPPRRRHRSTPRCHRRAALRSRVPV